MILTKQITTPKATIIVIGGLPEDTGYVELLFGDLFYAKEEGDWGLYIEHNMPHGKWGSVGFLKDLPEDVAKELVELVYDNGGTPDENGIDKIYQGCEDDPNIMGGACENAVQALHSLVAANCLLKNKYGEKPKSLDEYARRNEDSNGLSYIDPYQKAFYDRYLGEYKLEQEKIFTNPYLCRQIKD